MRRPAESEDYNADAGVIEIYPALCGPMLCISCLGLEVASPLFFVRRRTLPHSVTVRVIAA